MSALPANLAEEAQTLRREYELRNRAMMNERFFSHATHGSLSSILRNTVRGLGSQVSEEETNCLNKIQQKAFPGPSLYIMLWPISKD